MRVALSVDAELDLEDIADAIAVDSPNRAESFVLELVAAARQIGRVPRGYPVVLKRGAEPIRRKVFGNYLIFYLIERDRVDVVRILHGARDYERLFNRRDL